MGGVSAMSDCPPLLPQLLHGRSMKECFLVIHCAVQAGHGIIRVGDDTWLHHDGECVVWDESFEHTAENQGEARLVLEV